MTDYTPTTGEVRHLYSTNISVIRGRGLGESVEDAILRLSGQFDRWLNAQLADAWDEGYENGTRDEAHYARGLSTDPGADEVPHSNPYRTADQ